MIQNVQEKLSLITHDPASSINWEDVLFSAALSINTTTQTTTGFTPFELMFGRKNPKRCETLEEIRTPHVVYDEKRQAAEEHMFEKTVQRQSIMQQTQKTRYDQRRRDVAFEIGSLVMAKQMGRRSKLQNRFTGPYEVVNKNNDIYDIKSTEGRSEKLQRHINDLKPHHSRADSAESALDEDDINANNEEAKDDVPVALILSDSYIRAEETQQKSSFTNLIYKHRKCLSSLTQISMKITLLIVILLTQQVNTVLSSVQFEEAPVITWHQSRAYVTAGHTNFKLALKFGSPCNIFLQHGSNTNTISAGTEQAVRQCAEVYREQISIKLLRIAKITSTKTAVVYAPLGNTMKQNTVNTYQNRMPTGTVGIQAMPPSLNNFQQAPAAFQLKPNGSPGQPVGYKPANQDTYPIMEANRKAKRGLSVVDFCLSCSLPLCARSFL